MKIVNISTTDNVGGAAMSCLRVTKAIRTLEPETKLLVHHANLKEPWIDGIAKTPIHKLAAFYREWAERIQFWLLYEANKSVRFSFSDAQKGACLSKHPWVKEADIIHLHWVHKGLVSLETLSELDRLGKPIVWTLHDMWVFTGGCHYSAQCTHYQNTCGNCFHLKEPSANDLSHWLWMQKQQVFDSFKSKWQFVTSSVWLKKMAESSSLLQNYNVQALLTPIETDVFCPMDKQEARKALGIETKKPIVLFLAANLADKRKGFDHFKQIMALLPQYEVLLVGKYTPELLADFPNKYYALGSVNSPEKLRLAYCAAEVFAMPSTQDNLPNTILEALASGTPVAAFATGGIPEMFRNDIDGYIVPALDYQTFSQSITKIIENHHSFSKNARSYASENYSYNAIAEAHLKLYRSLLSN